MISCRWLVNINALAVDISIGISSFNSSMQFEQGISQLKQTGMLVFHTTVIGSLSVKGVAVSVRQGLFRHHWSWHQWIILSVACSPNDQFPVACLASVSRIFCFKWLNAWNSSSLQIKLATTLCIPKVNLTWSGCPVLRRSLFWPDINRNCHTAMS